MNLIGKDVPCIEGTGEQEAKKLKIYKFVLKYLFKLIQIPLVIYALVLSSSNKGFYLEIKDKACSDSDVMGAINLFSNMIDKIDSSNKTIIYSLFITIIIDIVLEIIMNKKKKKD